MTRRLALVAAMLIAPTAAAAQPRESVGLQGFAMAGVSLFTASQSFDAILDTHSGPIFGGGLRLTIPGGPYLEVGARRFSKDGERGFVGANQEVFQLGIATTFEEDELGGTSVRIRLILGR